MATTDYNKRLGHNLRNARRSYRGPGRTGSTRAPLSLDDVAVQTGGEFKASVVGAYERGERAITAVRLHDLCEFYGVAVRDMLPEEEDES